MKFIIAPTYKSFRLYNNTLIDRPTEILKDDISILNDLTRIAIGGGLIFYNDITDNTYRRILTTEFNKTEDEIKLLPSLTQEEYEANLNGTYNKYIPTPQEIKVIVAPVPTGSEYDSKTNKLTVTFDKPLDTTATGSDSFISGNPELTVKDVIFDGDDKLVISFNETITKTTSATVSYKITDSSKSLLKDAIDNVYVTDFSMGIHVDFERIKPEFNSIVVTTINVDECKLDATFSKEIVSNETKGFYLLGDHTKEKAYFDTTIPKGNKITSTFRPFEIFKSEKIDLLGSINFQVGYDKSKGSIYDKDSNELESYLDNALISHSGGDKIAYVSDALVSDATSDKYAIEAHITCNRPMNVRKFGYASLLKLQATIGNVVSNWIDLPYDENNIEIIGNALKVKNINAFELFDEIVEPVEGKLTIGFKYEPSMCEILDTHRNILEPFTATSTLEIVDATGPKVKDIKYTDLGETGKITVAFGEKVYLRDKDLPLRCFKITSPKNNELGLKLIDDIDNYTIKDNTLTATINHPVSYLDTTNVSVVKNNLEFNIDFTGDNIVDTNDVIATRSFDVAKSFKHKLETPLIKSMVYNQINNNSGELITTFNQPIKNTTEIVNFSLIDKENKSVTIAGAKSIIEKNTIKTTVDVATLITGKPFEFGEIKFKLNFKSDNNLTTLLGGTFKDFTSKEFIHTDNEYPKVVSDKYTYVEDTQFNFDIKFDQDIVASGKTISGIKFIHNNKAYTPKAKISIGKDTITLQGIKPFGLIETKPNGKVDFKIRYTPIDGEITDKSGLSAKDVYESQLYTHEDKNPPKVIGTTYNKIDNENGELTLELDQEFKVDGKEINGLKIKAEGETEWNEIPSEKITKDNKSIKVDLKPFEDTKKKANKKRK